MEQVDYDTVKMVQNNKTGMASPPKEASLLKFIKTYLPENGVFGTADLFREKMGITKRDDELNERFCKLLEEIADLCPGGTYDPVYIKSAIKAIHDSRKNLTTEEATKREFSRRF